MTLLIRFGAQKFVLFQGDIFQEKFGASSLGRWVCVIRWMTINQHSIYGPHLDKGEKESGGELE
jgi:hypothetical protein